MYYAIRGRQQGKTHDLLKWAEGDPNRVVLCADERRVRHAQDMALRGGINLAAHQVRNVRDFLGAYGTRPPPAMEFAIDDLQDSLRSAFGLNIVAASDTGTSPLPPTSGQALREAERSLINDLYSKQLSQQLTLPFPDPPIRSTPTKPSYTGIVLGGPVAGQTRTEPNSGFMVVMQNTDPRAWTKGDEGIDYGELPRYRYSFMVWKTKTRIGDLTFWAAPEDHAYWLWKLEPYLNFFLSLCPPKHRSLASAFPKIPVASTSDEKVLKTFGGSWGGQHLSHLLVDEVAKPLSYDEIAKRVREAKDRMYNDTGVNPQYILRENPTRREYDVINDQTGDVLMTLTEDQVSRLKREEDPTLRTLKYLKPPKSEGQKLFQEAIMAKREKNSEEPPWWKRRG